MPPKRTCSCHGHIDLVKASDKAQVHTIDGSKKAATEYMRGELCIDCFDFALSNSENYTNTSNKTYTFEEFCHKISYNEVNPDQIVAL